MDNIKTTTSKIVADILKKIKQHLININTSVILNSQENIKIEQNKLIKFYYILTMVLVSTSNKRKLYQHLLQEGVFCCKKVI